MYDLNNPAVISCNHLGSGCPVQSSYENCLTACDNMINCNAINYNVNNLQCCMKGCTDPANPVINPNYGGPWKAASRISKGNTNTVFFNRKGYCKNKRIMR